MASMEIQQRESDVYRSDADLEKHIVRKIDYYIIPVLFVTYMFNFMDKVILSSAAVFGLREDNNLKGQEYSWVSSIFYFGYLVWAYPTTLLIARLPVASYMTANTFFWGIAVAVTAACSSYGGLMTVRFFLGVAEATITPAFMFLTSSWYTRDEIPTRTGLWFSGNSIGGMLASLLAFGLGHVEDNVGPWRWMYIILGICTFLWAFAIWFLLPNSISSARFLTPEERKFAGDRVVIAGTGRTEESVWRQDQFIEALIDPKTWLVVGIELTQSIPNSGTQNFANIVIKSFGFTSLQSTLINIPYSILAAATIFGTGWLAGRFRKMNCILIVCVVLPCIIGSAIIYCRDRIPAKGVHLFGYFLLCTGPAVMPLALTLVQANCRGVTKKMTMSALLFLSYCAGNIAGPHFFKQAEEPTYNTAFRTIMISYALVAALAMILRGYLQWMNHKRAKEQGFEGSAGTSGTVRQAKAVPGPSGSHREEEIDGVIDEAELRPEDYEDVTDWKIPGFRYRL